MGGSVLCACQVLKIRMALTIQEVVQEEGLP